MRTDGESGEKTFFSEINKIYPEFEARYRKSRKETDGRKLDLLQYLIENSDFLAKEENRWMKTVIEAIRSTSVFLQPQIRTKIMNEGWASYWHEKLFLQDDRIGGHEVDFARTHAGVTSLPRVGLNPYALGMRLFYYIEELGDKGKYSIEFRRLTDTDQRRHYDAGNGQGREFIFKIRETLSDFTFVNTFVDQEFTDQNKLFVAGKRLNRDRMVWEYYVKSRKANDYRKMLLDSLYHPPHIEIDRSRGEDNTLYMVHHFEGKPLVRDFIANTMIGIEYLWGSPVQLETSEVIPSAAAPASVGATQEGEAPKDLKWERVVYTSKNKELTREVIGKQG